MSLHQFCLWLGATPLSQAIANTAWIIPTVQTLHILAIAALFSSAALVDLRLLRVVGGQEPTIGFARRFLPWIWVALPVLFVSGAVLITAEPYRSLENPVFQLKMALLILAVLVTALLQRPLAQDDGYWEGEGARAVTGKALALTSLALWACIICAGRWIAYV